MGGLSGRVLSAVCACVALLAISSTVRADGGGMDSQDSVEITGEREIPPFKLARLRLREVPEKSAILWRVSPSSVDMAVSPRGLLQFCASPGTYVVSVIVISPDGQGGFEVKEGSATVRFLQPQPPPQPQPPQPQPPQPQPPQPQPPQPQPPQPQPPQPQPPTDDPRKAICQVRFDLGGGRYGFCTTCPVHPRRPDGRYLLLCAAHCMPPNASGEVRMKDGVRFTAKVIAHERRSDIAWMLTDRADLTLPTCKLATVDPPVGTKVWHAGYGVDVPENVEVGVVSAPRNSEGQIKYRLSVSSGDSGGPIFWEERQEIVGTVCCTSAKGRMADVWAGSATRARELIRSAIPDYESRPLSGSPEWYADPVDIPSCRKSRGSE